MILFNFPESPDTEGWKVVNDGVMGGRSTASFTKNTEGHALFFGHVSLENNGGFASVQYRNDFSVKAYQGLEIRLRGDGKRYQFRLKSSLEEAHSYIHQFETSGDWERIRIPFSGMYPAYRGTTLALPNFPGTHIAQVGFLIGNKKESDFEIQLDRCTLY